MNVTYIITDQQKFEREVKEVDLMGFINDDNSFDGSIYISTNDGKISPSYGLFDLDEFVEEYGFVIQET